MKAKTLNNGNTLKDAILNNDVEGKTISLFSQEWNNKEMTNTTVPGVIEQATGSKELVKRWIKDWGNRRCYAVQTPDTTLGDLGYLGIDFEFVIE